MNIVVSLLKKTSLYNKIYHPYRVRQEQIRFQKRIQNFEKGGLILLEKFAAIMDNKGIPYWLEFGSLLGAFRDNAFIKNDFDIDVGVQLSDASQIYKLLIDNGFELVREFHVRGENGLEQTYLYSGTTIDLFDFFPDGNAIKCNGFYNAQSKQIGKYFDICVSEFIFEPFGLMKMAFLGLSIKVPSNIERHIIEVYGEGYRVYDPNFTDGYNKVKYPITEKVGCGYFIR